MVRVPSWRIRQNKARSGDGRAIEYIGAGHFPRPVEYFIANLIAQFAPLGAHARRAKLGSRWQALISGLVGLKMILYSLRPLTAPAHQPGHSSASECRPDRARTCNLASFWLTKLYPIETYAASTPMKTNYGKICHSCPHSIANFTAQGRAKSPLSPAQIRRRSQIDNLAQLHGPGTRAAPCSRRMARTSGASFRSTIQRDRLA